MPSRGTVAVTAEPRKLGDAPGIALEFADTGTGISKEDMHDAYYEMELKGNLTFFNDALCKLHKRSLSLVGNALILGVLCVLAVSSPPDDTIEMNQQRRSHRRVFQFKTRIVAG